MIDLWTPEQVPYRGIWTPPPKRWQESPQPRPGIWRAAISIVQDVAFTSAADVSAVTGNVVANVATGTNSLLVLVVSARAKSANGTPSLTVTGGGTWVQRRHQASSANNFVSDIWELQLSGTGVGANGVTVKPSVAASMGYHFYEITGAANPAQDAGNIGSGSSTAPTVSATETDTDIVFGNLAWSNTATTISGLSAWSNNETLQTPAGTSDGHRTQIGYNLNVTGAQTYAGTLSVSGAWTATIQGYKTAAAAQGLPPTVLTLQQAVVRAANW